jgi:uracil phosphoribosyltransferase
MLATGLSMALVYQSLLANGTPKKIIIASTISTPQALYYLETVLPATASIWTAAIDPELNDKSYIIPGLGDAGDLAYGKKL